MRHRHRFMMSQRSENGVIALIQESGFTVTHHSLFSTADLYRETDIELINKLYNMGKYAAVIKEYTQQELDSATWLQIRPLWSDYYPQPEDDNKYLEVAYRRTKSCTCAAGLVQVSDFHIKPVIKKMKRPFLELNWVYDEIFISNEVKELLSASELHGFGFRTVRAPTSNDVQPNVTQLVIQQVIPSAYDFAKMEIGKDLSCPHCGEKRYFLKQGSPLVLRKAALEMVDGDIFKVGDYIGQGAIWMQQIFISQTFYKLLKSNRLDKALAIELPEY